MTLGNVVALAQRDIKRLLAYSGHRPHGLRHDHARRLRPGRPRGGDRLPLRLPRLERRRVRGRRRPSTATRPSRIRSALLAGEGRRSPFAAAVLALCLFSLAGIPATAGFIGKFFVFGAAIERGPLRARRHRHPQQPHLDRLLPEGRLHAVHARLRRAAGAAAARRPPTGSPWRSAPRRSWRSASSRPASGRWRVRPRRLSRSSAPDQPHPFGMTSQPRHPQPEPSEGEAHVREAQARHPARSTNSGSSPATPRT